MSGFLAAVALFALAMLPCQEVDQEGAWQVTRSERRSERWWAWDQGRNRPVQVALQHDVSLSFEEGDDPLFDSDGRWGPASGWIVLDSFPELRSGDVHVPVGRWYLFLEESDAAEWQLVLAEAGTVLRRRLGPGDLEEVPAARVIRLEEELGGEFHHQFACSLEDKDAAGFTLRMALAGSVFQARFDVLLDPVAGASGNRVREVGGTADRVSLRARAGADSHVTLAYNPAPWVGQPSGESRAIDAMVGRSWRLGRNFWTVLTCDVPLRIGAAEIPPGVWFVGLHYSRDGSTWQLALYDPVRVRAQRIDSNWISVAPAAMRLALVRDDEDAEPTDLSLDLVPEGDQLALHVAYGPHRLSQRFTPVTELHDIQPERHYLGWQGSVALVAGHYQDAVEHYQALATHFPKRAANAWYNAACAHAQLGDGAAAVRCLGKSLDAGLQGAESIHTDPQLAPAREHPTFAELANRLE